MSSIHYWGPKRLNLNSMFDTVNLQMRQDIMKLCYGLPVVYSSRCHFFTHSSVTSKSSCVSDPHSHQSPEEVLALNAAAIIANIKLQRQLSKKRTPNGNSEKDSTASPQGNTGTITSLYHSYVIIIYHLIKHWSLLQLTENVASSVLCFQSYISGWINTDTVEFLGSYILCLFDSYQEVICHGRPRGLLSNCALCSDMRNQARCRWDTNSVIFCALVVTEEGKCMKPHPDQSPVQLPNQPHAGFVHLSLDCERSPESISLQVSSDVSLFYWNKTMKQKVGD